MARPPAVGCGRRPAQPGAAFGPSPTIEALRHEVQSGLVTASVLKLNIDGGDAQYTAAMLTPYSDKPVTSRDTLPPTDIFADIIRRADREGIDIHIDSYGDRVTPVGPLSLRWP